MPSAEDLLRAVLMFHGSPTWDAACVAEWQRIIGPEDATTKALCDAIREHLATERRADELATLGEEAQS